MVWNMDVFIAHATSRFGDLRVSVASALYFFIGFFFFSAGSDYTHYSEVLKALNCTFSLSRIRIWLILPSTKISKVPNT